jgi:hypothetical protein
VVQSSICPSRRARFGTIFGSNVPFRLCGTSIVTGPLAVEIVLRPLSFRELPEPAPAGSSRV